MPPPRTPLTHFLCLPLVTDASRPQLQASLAQFASDVVRAGGDGELDVPERAIRPISTLHLTLGVMSLTDPQHLEGATGLLEALDLRRLLREAEKKKNYDDKEVTQTAREEISSSSADEGGSQAEGDPLIISLSGLTSMHPETRTSILYADPVDASNRLVGFGKELRDMFQRGGFLIPDNRPLLLHATILNTIYAKASTSRGNRGGGQGGSHREHGHAMRRGRLTIDASEIIQRYGSFVWAKDIRIERASICKMGAKKRIDHDGSTIEEYEEVCSKAMP